MKIVVLNGSPKGDVSVTRQYVLHLEKVFPQHRFVVLHVAQQSLARVELPAAEGPVVPLDPSLRFRLRARASYGGCRCFRGAVAPSRVGHEGEVLLG